MHLYIMLDDDILTLDTPEEIRDATDALRECGFCQARVWRGGPNDDPAPTDKLLTSSGLIDVSHEVFMATRDQ
jgi:hypothetical protein